MKKRTNPKVEAMRDRSLMVESERQNHERNYSLNEQKEYKDIEDIKSESQYKRLINEQERKNWELSDVKTGYPFDPQLDRELNDLVGGLILGKVSVEDFNSQKGKFFTSDAKIHYMYNNGGKNKTWDTKDIDDFIFDCELGVVLDGNRYNIDGYVKSNDKIIQLQIIVEPK